MLLTGQLDYVIEYGQAGNESLGHIDTDSAGNVYAAGTFDSGLDFSALGGPTFSTAGLGDIFVTKTSSDGVLQWARQIGSFGHDRVNDLEVDATGNVHLTGSFRFTVDFDPGGGTHNLTSFSATPDAFVLKLDTDGDFAWAKHFGRGREETGFAIDVDAAGNVHTVGSFNTGSGTSGSVDFDPGPGTFELSTSGLFISKLDTNGDFEWAGSFEGSQDLLAGFVDVGVDTDENVFVVGSHFFQLDVDPGAGVSNLFGSNNPTVYIAKLDGSGAAPTLTWARQFVSQVQGGGRVSGIAVGADGIFMTGRFTRTIDFDPGPAMFNLATGPIGGAAFVSMLDSDGNFGWAGAFDVVDTDVGSVDGDRIALDSSENVYVAGNFSTADGFAVDFDPGPGTFEVHDSDAGYVTKLSRNGAFRWTRVGINGEQEDDSLRDFAIDPNRDLFLTGGYRNAADVDPGPDEFLLTPSGGGDAFISKLLQPAAPHPLPLTSLDGDNGFRINGANAGDRIGFSSAAGDINNDGFEDAIIGAPSAGVGGEAYVVFGAPGGFPSDLDLGQLNGSNGFRMTGVPGDDVGSSVAAGDINGDGIDDIIIGADDANTEGVSTGAAFVVWGTDNGFPASLPLGTLDGNNGFRINGVAEDDSFGYSAASGDINADGYSDIVIGGADAHTTVNQEYEGTAYVLFGGPSFPAIVDAAALNGANGFAFSGLASFGSFASSADATGDINADGYKDLLVGARYEGAQGDGAAYVLFGRGSGFPASITTADLNGSNGFRLAGAPTDAELGNAVSSGGDVNGDGFDDILLGANQSDTAYIVYGTNQPFPVSLDVGTLDGANGFAIDNSTGETGFSTAYGDVNGDGYDDIFLGSHGEIADPSAHTIFGTSDAFPPVFDLATLDGMNGVRIDAPFLADRLGKSVATGDLNGDGFDDLLGGAWGADVGAMVRAGQTHVVFGGDFLGLAQVGDAAADTLTGTSNPDNLIGSTNDDILIGDGGADVLIGGQGNDTLTVADLNFMRIAGGRGIDTLTLTNESDPENEEEPGWTLDLTSVPDNFIQGIESIDIRGDSPNTLTLDVREVLNLSTHSNTLTVWRDDDDTLNMGGGWTPGETVVMNGAPFDSYTQGAATLLVQKLEIPVAVDDVAIVAPDSSTDIDVLVNDFPNPGSELLDFTQPANGTVTVNPDGTLHFEPSAGFSGATSFDYTIGLPQMKLSQDTPSRDSLFGRAVAISGDWAVVGAPGFEGPGDASGSAWILRRTGTTWETFQEIQADDASADARFGSAVAMANGTVLIGAPGDAGDRGAAYVFHRGGESGEFVQSRKLVDPQGRANDAFGSSVAMEINTAVVGSPFDDGGGTNSGSVFVFNRNRYGEQQWGLRKRIKAVDRAAGDQFGHDVAIHNRVMIVGARKSDAGHTDSGAAYVLGRDEGGIRNWGQLAKLVPDDSGQNDYFGSSVDIDSDTVVVGKPIRSDRARSGSAYVFDRDAGGADTWGQTASVAASPATATDEFGFDVAVSGDRVLVGSRKSDSSGNNNAGAAFVFGRDVGGAENWGLSRTLTAEDRQRRDHFGHSVAIDGSSSIVGAPLENPDRERDAGSVYLQDLSTDTATVDIAVTNDNMRASGTPVSNTMSGLRNSQLAGLLPDAIAWWKRHEPFERPYTFSVTDLPEDRLGILVGNEIRIDATAAGFGWFIDQTPWDLTDDTLNGRMDLMTVLVHEVGHLFGHDDRFGSNDRHDIMYGYLSAGERRVPTDAVRLDAVDTVLADLMTGWMDEADLTA